MLKHIKAVTLLEILTVVLIIGILIALALPRFGTMKERALDKEAGANLKLIQAAEKIYRMEIGVFWPDSGTATTPSLNTNLRLDLPTRNWTYQASSNSGDPPLDVQAARSDPPSGWNRTYYIDQDDEDACCCPRDSRCPSQDWCTSCP